MRLVVLVSGKTGLERIAWSRAVPGAHRLSGSVRGSAAGAGSGVLPPRPNIAMPASPPEQCTAPSQITEANVATFDATKTFCLTWFFRTT